MQNRNMTDRKKDGLENDVHDTEVCLLFEKTINNIIYSVT